MSEDTDADTGTGTDTGIDTGTGTDKDADTHTDTDTNEGSMQTFSEGREGGGGTRTRHRGWRREACVCSVRACATLLTSLAPFVQLLYVHAHARTHTHTHTHTHKHTQTHAHTHIHTHTHMFFLAFSALSPPHSLLRLAVHHSSAPLRCVLSLLTRTCTPPGTSGVLLEILLTAAARSLSAGSSFGEALEAGVDAIEFYGGARQGSRTMIDALRPAAAAWKAGKTLQEVAAAAREGADATKTMTASAGRANWVGKDSYDGVPDPGAAAVALVLEAAAKD